VKRDTLSFYVCGKKNILEGLGGGGTGDGGVGGERLGGEGAGKGGPAQQGKEGYKMLPQKCNRFLKKQMLW
jgi:hypothetical protein